MDPNWKRVCRACCCVVDFRDLKPIFYTPEANIIMVTMFPLKITEDDVLPKQICSECYVKIQETYKFLQQCVNSEKLLRDHVAKVEEFKKSKSLAVITESLYEQDTSMTEDSPVREVKEPSRGLVSRVKEFFESHSQKGAKAKTKVARLEQKMSIDEIPLPQDATINSTVVTDLDSFEDSLTDVSVTEEFVPPVKSPLSMKRTSSRRQFKCLYQSCSLRFETKMDRRKHMETHLNGVANVSRIRSSWKCKHCDAKFQNAELLLVHEKQHTAQVLYICDKCQKRFKTRANLTSHQKILCNARERHKCKICLKEFTHASTLYVHQIIHKPDAAKALRTLRSS